MNIEVTILSGSGRCLNPDNCLFCGKGVVTFWQDKPTESGTYGIWRCEFCRSGFVWPRPDDSELAALYTRPAYGSVTRKEADFIDTAYYPTSWGDAEIVISRCVKLAKGWSFLDVGAGNGTFSHVATKRGFLVSAIEPNENARAVFREVNGFRPQKRLFDRAFAEQAPRSYDVALLSQVLEHMPHPLEAVKNLHTVLQPGGIAAIAVPHFGSLLSRLQDTSDMFISPPEHLNFFSRRGLAELFLKNGFSMRLIETVSKVPRRRIERLARLRLLGAVGWRATYAAMRLSDWCNAGMVLNAYFEKTEE
jgi:SAM-dependent methyltransferase